MRVIRFRLSALPLLVFLLLSHSYVSGQADYSILASFQYKYLTEHGGGPTGLIADGAGNLYGAASLGGPINGGLIFKLTHEPNGKWLESVLYGFVDGTDGYSPSALILDKAGNLYGVNALGGSANCGAVEGCGSVFELSPDSDGAWKLTVLHDFAGGDDGTYPVGLTLASDGNLYGTTRNGGGFNKAGVCSGEPGCGTVFMLRPATGGGWTETVLHRFTGNEDGSSPYAGVVLDKEGNLYGTTSQAGDPTCTCGVVFRLSPNEDETWTETVLHAFKGKESDDGSYPLAGLVMDSSGNLYGATSSGGSSANWGTVFELAPASDVWTEKVLHVFTGGKDGGSPAATLVRDGVGNLYGSTVLGGVSTEVCEVSTGTCGVVFELMNGCSTETVLHTFWGYASYPTGIVLDQRGNVLGVAARTSDGQGAVFEIAR
jgi:uncharacterized repeat protein (TIGR03803 family)